MTRPLQLLVLGIATSVCASARPCPQDEPADTGQQPLPGWVRGLERLELYGDLRLRHESTFPDDDPERHRQRARLRFGANYEVSDGLLAGARITTGDPGDPNSPHVTFGDGFDSFELSLDRLFLKWRPQSVDWFSATAGKFQHSFKSGDVYGELLWDADVQPEGALLESSFANVGAFERVDVRLGAYTLLEQSVDDDASMGAAQVSGSVRLGESTLSTLALGYYLYGDVTPDGAETLLDDNGGNATFDRDGDSEADEFVSDFGILDAIAGITFDSTPRPLRLSAQYMHNHRARVDEDSGWAAGVSYGSTQERGDWRAYYQWQVVEQDAVFSPFAQDDFLFATNHRSHVAGIVTQLTDSAGLHLWGLWSEQDSGGDEDGWRLRIDLNVKF